MYLLENIFIRLLNNLVKTSEEGTSKSDYLDTLDLDFIVGDIVEFSWEGEDPIEYNIVSKEKEVA